MGDDRGEPPLVLRGYRKTPLLEPGESARLVFGLTAGSLSIWDSTRPHVFVPHRQRRLHGEHEPYKVPPPVNWGSTGRGGWKLVRGKFTAYIGSSSRNASLSHAFEVT